MTDKQVVNKLKQSCKMLAITILILNNKCNELQDGVHTNILYEA